MKNIFICFMLFLLASHIVKAQKPSPTFDHIAILVENLDTSVDFYNKLFQLDSLPNPFPKARVKWYSLGAPIQFHIIEGLKEPIAHPLLNHMCLSIASIDVFIAELKKNSIPYYNGQGTLSEINVRGDGVKQLFIKDPDGYWVEVNNAVH